jgi:hypothetical protein
MQAQVAEAPDTGVPGDIADLWTAKNGARDSATSEEASATIPFGVMVIRGTGDGGAKRLHTSAATCEQLLLGISVRSHDFAIGSELDDDGALKPGATFAVGRKGRYRVLVEDAVSPGDSVRVRAVAAGDEVPGAFMTGADGTDAIDISAFAQWRTSADAGEVAVVEIDMTNSALAVADT